MQCHFNEPLFAFLMIYFISLPQGHVYETKLVDQVRCVATLITPSFLYHTLPFLLSLSFSSHIYSLLTHSHLLVFHTVIYLLLTPPNPHKSPTPYSPSSKRHNSPIHHPQNPMPPPPSPSTVSKTQILQTSSQC
jgi:hypothetical protein